MTCPSLLYRASSLTCCTPLRTLQAARPRAIVDLVHSAERLRLRSDASGTAPRPGTCMRCGYLSSQAVCKACVLLEGLNKGLPRLGVSRTRKKGGNVVADLSTEPLEHANGGTVAGVVRPGKDGCGDDGQPGACRSGQGDCACDGAGANEVQHAYLVSKQPIAAHPSARSSNAAGG